MATPRHVPTINLDNAKFFDGVEVASREPARIYTGLVPNGYSSPVIDMVLLENENTIFQCRKCAKTFPAASSGAAHQKSHSAKIELKNAQKTIDQLELNLKTPRPAVKTPRKVARRRQNVTTTSPAVTGKVTVTHDWKKVLQRIHLLQSNLAELETEVTRLANGGVPNAEIATLREKAARYDALREVIK